MEIQFFMGIFCTTSALNLFLPQLLIRIAAVTLHDFV